MNIGFFSGVTTAFREGGIWMMFIMAAQIVSLIIIAERYLALYVHRKPNQKSLVANFERDIKSGQLDRVIDQARAMGDLNPIAVVAQVGAQAAMDMGGKEEIQLKIDEVLLEEQSRLEKRTSFLAMLGNVGTLLGLLGTIVGLIRAFSSVGAASAVEKASILSQGVSEAMYATAYGLIMALPALVMFSVLQNRSNQLSEDLSKAALKIYILLGFHYESVPANSDKNPKA
jgi:biopolymer transport protein ExbB/TolQ